MKLTIDAWAKFDMSVTPANIGASRSARTVINQIQQYAEDLKKVFPQSEIFVIGTHLVYSAIFPVVCVEIPEVGLKVYGSCNYSDWSLTVESERAIKGFQERAYQRALPFFGCFNGFESSNAPFYEGGYNADNRRFSFFAAPPPNDTLRDIVMELITAQQG